MLDAATFETPYIFRATATDGYGRRAACDVRAQATRVVPPDGLRVELTRQEDEPDVDLHLLNPTGNQSPRGATGYFNSPNDCFFANLAPDWGVLGQTVDNPRLSLDDTTGFGPEDISLPRPQAGHFRLGAHYYCDGSRGPSHATVRIFCGGLLVAEFGPQRLARSGDFWDVAEIEFPGCLVTELGQVYAVTQGCHGF